MHKKSILVPVDFSSHSKAAIVFAGALADQLKIPLTILHIVHDPAEAPGYYRKKHKRLGKMEDTAKELMVEFLGDAGNSNPELKALQKAEPMLVVGLPVTQILRVAEKLRPLMLVMGSQGRTGLARLGLGSKAEQVARLCPLPVTIVKASKN